MREGAILRNRYRLDSLLDRGGMSEVFLAFDLYRQTQVAVKLLRADLAEDPEFVERFRREARALSLLDHPHIVRFYSFEVQGANAFIVMEYVRGITLRRHLREVGRPLPLAHITSILRQVGSALQYAHNEEIIHRDVKPGNIMLRSDGTALLSDFGIARAAESVTMTQGPLGAPAYMSPEQVLGRATTSGSDIYSLGIVLFELAAGRRPFTSATGTGSTTVERVRYGHLHLEPPNPMEFNRALSQESSHVILRALAKDPADRWPDVLSMVQAWEQSVGEEMTVMAPARQRLSERAPEPSHPAESAPPLVAAGIPVPLAVTTPKPTPEPRSRPTSLAVAAIFVVATALLLVFSQLRPIANDGRRVTTTAAVQATQVALAASEGTTAAAQQSTTGVQHDTQPTSTPGAERAGEAMVSSGTPAPPTQASVPPTNASVSTTSSEDMVLVPAGDFLMGSAASDSDAESTEMPQHTVYLDDFWIDRTEVTNAQYRECVDAGACPAPTSCDWGIPTYRNISQSDYPVVCVSWNEARDYCAWANKRLPTEAEWEKAARGVNGRIYPWGDQFECSLGNFDDETLLDDYTVPGGANCDGYDRTAPVGSYPQGASPYGALDMAGNVWEWVADWYDEDYYGRRPVSNPTGPESGDRRVLRGGSWIYVTSSMRAANRSGSSPDDRFEDYGFRCAHTP